MQNLKKIHRLLFYILILLLPAQLAKHFWPPFSFVSGIRIDYLSPTIYLTDIIILGILIIWGIERLLSLRSFARAILHRRIDKYSNPNQQQSTRNIKRHQRINIYNYHSLLLLCRSKLIAKNTTANPMPNNTLNKSTLSTREITGSTSEPKKTTDRLEKYSDNLSSSAGNNILPRFNFLFLGMLTYSILNISHAAQPMVAFLKWLKVTELTLLALYIIKTKPSLHITLYTLLITSALSALLAWAQFAKGGSIGGILYWIGERSFTINTPGIATQAIPYITASGKMVLRPYATFSHPNVLAGFLTATFPFLFSPTKLFSSNLLLRSSKFTRFLQIFFILLWLVTIFITGSQIALLVSLCIVYLFLNHRNKIIFTISILLVLLIFNFQFSIFNQAPIFNFQTQNTSITRRWELIKAAINMFKTSPIIGVGLNNFIIRLPEFTKSTEPTFFLQPVHNIFLLILAEGGIVGLVLFLAVLWKVLGKWLNGYMVKWLKPKHNARQAIQPFSNLAIIPTVSLLALGLFDHYLLTLQQGMLLFVIVMAYTSKETK
jgi:O-antigen ligase